MVIKTSLIDWFGEMEGGVGAFIGFTINDKVTLEGLYWVHPDGRRELEIERNFLIQFNVKVARELPFIDELYTDIESILPSRDEIFNSFLVDAT